MNEIDVIKDARDHIAAGYWWKGSARGPSGGCAVTTLSDSAKRLGLRSVFGEKAADLVAVHVPDHTHWHGLCRLAAFNDWPTTIRQDVVNAFDKTLAEAGAL